MSPILLCLIKRACGSLFVWVEGSLLKGSWLISKMCIVHIGRAASTVHMQDRKWRVANSNGCTEEVFTLRNYICTIVHVVPLQPCGAWWRPKGRGFECRSSRHEGTLGKPFTHSCLRRFGVKLRHSIRAVSGAPLSSGGLEEAL